MRKALSNIKKISSALISFIFFALEQLVYLEILGAEYMAFCPQTEDEKHEEVFAEMKMKFE